MGSLRNLQKNWEILAQEDPLWAICSDPQKRHGQWNEDEFFATGRQEVEKVLAHVRSLGLHPDGSLPALDFGCGVGRLTRALSAHFSEAWGVDISPTMIERAREFHRDNPRCRFLVNPTSRLEQLSGGYFGFIYTSIVLQHIDPQHSREYLAELLRVLRPSGILVFQAVDRYKAGLLRRLRGRLALRSRIQLLLGMDISSERRVRMHCLPEKIVRRVVEQGRGRIVDIQLTNSVEPSFNGHLAYLDEEPAENYVSRQYCVLKGE